MYDDVLKKPVHVALLKKSYIKTLEDAGKLPKTLVSISAPIPPQVKDDKPHKLGLNVPKITKQNKLRTSLRIMYDAVLPLTKDKIPPCDSCIGACCYVFLVDLTEEEYESGLFGEAAVKLTVEAAEQLRSKVLLGASSTVPSVFRNEISYILEGRVGDPCPFLVDSKCSIYEDRPLVCRTYTCVGDSRITDDMRKGKAPLVVNRPEK